METLEKPTPAEIGRANEHDVRIVWKDGHKSLYLARDLRLACPCATCVEEMSGRKMLDETRVIADVHPLSLNLVGRYALHFNFSDGHTTGIFTFEYLRGLCRCRDCKPSDGRIVEAPVIQKSKLTPQTTMGAILEQYPTAKGTLFRRYHVGGCSSCGYEPEDTLEKVMKSHNVLDMQEVISHIEQSEELTRKILIEPRELAALLKSPNPPKLLDTRTPDEWAMAKLEGARLVDENLSREIMEKWSKETPVVLYCHVGERSLDAASYLIGHGFTNVRSLSGGIDAWSQNVDSKVPRY